MYATIILIANKDCLYKLSHFIHYLLNTCVSVNLSSLNNGGNCVPQSPGSHGAGLWQETQTPFVTWGSGIRRPVISTSNNCGHYSDKLCTDWQLENIERSDIKQADVAALMAHLVGTPLPVNSVGRLPVSVLDAPPQAKANALLANAEQILAQFQVCGP